MKFPLPEPGATTVMAMSKAWRRTDLERYLKRWQHLPDFTVPAALFKFPWCGLDIGCGFGKYILAQSKDHPERGYLGIDKGTLRGGRMVRQITEEDRPNLFGMQANVTPVLSTLPQASFNEITVHYPNPWWPAKHRKKRWSYHPLLPRIIDLLKPGAAIILTSNESFYLREWLYALRHHPKLAQRLSLCYAGPIEAGQGRSHFEIKFLAQGIPCGEIRFTRK